MIELAAGGWRARLRPEIGGSITALSCDGLPFLRTMADQADHPLQAGCFPLVPYANRIAAGRFSFGGHAARIEPNLQGQNHPLHGFGWLAEWQCIRHDGSSALLEHAFVGSAEWPWPYVAHQHVALDENGLTIRLMVCSTGDRPAPMGLGLHPYFRRTRDTILTFRADAMLGIDDECLVDGSRSPADTLAQWSDGAALPDVLVDHCFAQWRGTATIADEHGIIAIEGFGTPHCHVYAPPGGEELCIEPVSHTPDALNRAPKEMIVLPPGCAAGIAMRIAAAPAVTGQS